MEAGRHDADDARALAARWARPRADGAAGSTVEAPQALPRLHVAVDGADVEASAVVVSGHPTPAQVRGSLATLVLAEQVPALHAATAALAGAAASTDAPLGRVARAESVLRSLARRAGPSGRLVALAVVAAAAIAALGVPLWMLLRDAPDLRRELDDAALLSGASSLVLAVALLVQARLGRAADGSRRALATHEVLGAVVAGAWLVAVVGALAWRATTLGAWSLAIEAALALHVAAGGVAGFALVAAIAPERIGGAAVSVDGGSMLATPAMRLRSLAEAFDAHVASLDAAGWRRLDEAIDAHVERLAAERVLAPADEAAVRTVEAHPLAFDGALAARLALEEGTVVRLGEHVPLDAVAAIVDGGGHGGRLATRIVRAVTGERSRTGTPWEAGMLVDLVAAARVPVLATGGAAVVATLARTVALAAAGVAIAAALLALAIWTRDAGVVAAVAQPIPTVALLAGAVLLVAAVDVGERRARLRSAPTTTAWAGIALAAASSAAVVGTATPYSPYLVGARIPWVVALGLVALVAAAALGVRVVERVRGRVHDAVHWRSACWPLAPGRVAALERARAARIRAASRPHVDAIALRLHPALALAVDLGRLDARALASLPAAR